MGHRRTARPIVIPGTGSVVLLNALGLDWAVTVEAIGRRAGRTERLVVVTDQPVMHLARELPIVVEFLPMTDLPHGDDPRVAARLAEITRVYAVERIERATGDPDDGSDTMPRC